MPRERADPAKASPRARRTWCSWQQIRRVYEANFRVYGVRKVWRQLGREGIAVARCTVARLMRRMGLQGAVRGKATRTTIADKATPCPLDRVNRQFRAPQPNALWVSDFTYVATWQGFVYVAFVIDVFARRIVGWRVSRTAQADFVLDALEQALHERRPRAGRPRPSQRPGRRNTLRFATPSACSEAGIEPSVGSVGDSYDNALAETHQRPVQDRGDPPARPLAQRWRRSSSPPSNGSTGSTTAACSNRSATSRPPRPKRATMPSQEHAWRPDQTKRPPANPMEWMPPPGGIVMCQNDLARSQHTGRLP